MLQPLSWSPHHTAYRPSSAAPLHVHGTKVPGSPRLECERRKGVAAALMMTDDEPASTLIIMLRWRDAVSVKSIVQTTWSSNSARDELAT